MTSRRTHLVSLVPPAILAIILGYHPGYLLAMTVGVLLPNVDAAHPRLHRSWAFHTFLVPAILYQGVELSGIAENFPTIVLVLNFITVGLVFHFVLDFAYPKQMAHDGAEWPVRPTVFSDPWGLMWLGLSWFIQWFLYLSDVFVPWVLGL